MIIKEPISINVGTQDLFQQFTTGPNVWIELNEEIASIYGKALYSSFLIHQQNPNVSDILIKLSFFHLRSVSELGPTQLDRTRTGDLR